LLLPNEKQIRCRPQARATAISDSAAWPRGAAHLEEFGPTPACRLHLRVRHQPRAEHSGRRSPAHRCLCARLVLAEPRFAARPDLCSWAAGTLRLPRRGRRLRPPLRSGILPTSGRRHSARTSGGPRRPGAGAANSTQGSPSKYNRDGGRRSKSRFLRVTSHHQVVFNRVVPNDWQISCRPSRPRHTDQ
jgi:hypothetical protein